MGVFILIFLTSYFFPREYCSFSVLQHCGWSTTSLFSVEGRLAHFSAWTQRNIWLPRHTFMTYWSVGNYILPLWLFDLRLLPRPLFVQFQPIYTICNLDVCLLIRLGPLELFYVHFLTRFPLLSFLFVCLFLSTLYKYIYIWSAYDKFPDFFRMAFKIVVDSWKFSMLLLYILWHDWPSFMISSSNEQLQ